MATLIKENGSKQVIKPENGTNFQLGELQELVDGYIDILYLKDDKIMVVNDDGKFTKGMNIEATQMAYDNKAIFLGDYISGDVVICNNNEVK